jgi:DNA-binding MarR family transcriptional regulator
VTIDEAARRTQFAYPRIYYACHTRHARRRSNRYRLSTRDAEILVHLDSAEPLTLAALARHLDRARSTLSEAVSALEALGYVTKAGHVSGDRRQVGLRLTPAGVAAVHGSSVLEAARLRAAFRRLSSRERAAVVAGLDLLARASRPRRVSKGR